ncbi:MAG: VCBS repeat-containing protein [Rhodospirillales bacterium]|nr:VCBS repeat-containing protein [Rhodospirillales bacterium]MDH3911276.1 VCBS repeat-containing protein [Rhodospirillales bacterium]MDH3967090.1 VCBS repeat-containing protein [Rhodospirillales bacterium]
MFGSRTYSRLALSLLTATCLTPPGVAVAAVGDAAGRQTRVNTETADNQRFPAVATAPDGDYVVVWQSQGQDGDLYGVFAQRFDAAGTALGPEFPVNAATTKGQRNPAVAMDADGDFVVAWESGQGTTYDIFARRFDAAGTPLDANEFQVNTTTTNVQRVPAVAMDDAGNFVVAWEGLGLDGSFNAVFARRYDAAGGALGGEFQVNTHTTLSQEMPAVAMDFDGDFVVAWQSGEQDGDFYGVFVRRYDAAGNPLDVSEVQVNNFTTGSQQNPAVAMDFDGNFVVAWRSDQQDGDNFGVFVKRFDAAGTALDGADIQVNVTTTGSQTNPAVAMDFDGDFVVAWHGDGLGDGFGIFARRFDAAGTALGGEFLVNTVTAQAQTSPAVAMDADGDFVVAWESYVFPTTIEVFAQRFQGPDKVAGDFNADARRDILWRNTTTGNAILWQMDGFVREAEGSVGSADPVWQIAGINDFDGDGQADILWRHTTSGNTILWRMSGFERLATGSIGNVPPVWEIADTSDLDGDAKADILWRNSSTGGTILWRMDGFTVLAAGSIGNVDPVWQVQMARGRRGFAVTGDALGREIPVNSFTTDAQGVPAVALAADGDFVVAWQSKGQDDPSDTSYTTGYGVFAQRFDAAGNALDGEFQVNTFTTGRQRDAAVASDPAGNFLVVWGGNGTGDSYGVFARRYDVAGAALAPEFLVNSFTTGTQRVPAAAVDDDGDFVVVWAGSAQDGDGSGIFAQRYDAAGNPLGGEFPVNTVATNNQGDPAVAMDADGDFVVVWQSGLQDGDGYGVFARRFDAAGSPLDTPEFQVNVFTAGDQERPGVAMDADGDFAVTWQSYAQDGSDLGVFARLFDAAGAALGGEIPVNSFTTGAQGNPALAMDGDGDFVVAWDTPNQDGNLGGVLGVFAQRFDAAGNPLGGEFQVNTWTIGDQELAAVAMDPDGDFVLAWASDGQDDPAGFYVPGIFAQRYAGADAGPGDFDADGRTDILWRNTTTGSAVLWQMDGFTKKAADSIGVVGTDWQIVGLGDFDGDGQSDVLWRNTGNGNTILWRMSGFKRLEARSIGAPALVWEVSGVGDLSGDQKADIVWRNTSTGATVVWQMDGFVKEASASIGGVPLVWQIE